MVYFRGVFTFVLCSTLDYKEREISKYLSTDDVFVAEHSSTEILRHVTKLKMFIPTLHVTGVFLKSLEKSRSRCQTWFNK